MQGLDYSIKAFFMKNGDEGGADWLGVGHGGWLVRGQR